MVDRSTPPRNRVAHPAPPPSCLARTSWRVAAALAAILVGSVRAQDVPPAAGVAALKELSIDDLMNLEVTSVSKRPEKLSETASAIQVITGDEIQRSAATNLPDALRLLPNVRVAQVNAYAWVVTTRGFSNIFANKLLVLVDGRTVYTPLFAGVFWDVQNVPLEDVDRIEAISGPGGTLWGANAVNGVINITTKSARDTQGGYVSIGAGSVLEDNATVRYGGKLGPNLYYRVYGQTDRREASTKPNGVVNADASTINTSGLRLDWYPSEIDSWTLEGTVYDGREHTRPTTNMTGADVIGRWTRQSDAGHEIGVQVFHDRTWRDAPSDFVTDELETSDFDFHHRFPLGSRQSVVWGTGYRFMRSTVVYHTPFVAFLPNTRDMDLFSAFAMDELTLIPDRLKLTGGSKLEHNSFSGWEVQPSGRLAWTPDARQTLWASVSRAIRAPSRIDVDYHLPGVEIQPGTPGVDGGPNFDAEKVIAYEAGYRVQPAATVALSLATFYNDYDDLYSVEALPGTPTYQIQNGSQGHTWGAELSGDWRPVPRWHVRAGYTYFREHLSSKPGHTFDTTLLANDPRHQWLLQSSLDLPAHLQCDVVLRSVGSLPRPAVAGYTVVDARVAWTLRGWECSVGAQNLGAPSHVEFGGGTLVERMVYGRVTVRW